MRLNTKFILIIIPLLVIPFSGIGVLAYQKLNESGLSSSFNQAKTVLSEIRSDIESFKQTTRSNLVLLSNDALLRKYVISDEDYRYQLIMPALLKLFNSYQKVYPQYYEIRFLLPNGFEDVRKTERDINNQAENESGTSIGKRLMSSSTEPVTFFAKNPDNDEYSFYASTPLVLSNDAVDSLTTPPKLRGYLSLTVSVDWLKMKIKRSPIGKSGFVFVSDHDGNLVFYNDRTGSGEKPITVQQLFRDSPDLQYINNLLKGKTLAAQDSFIKLDGDTGYLWSLRTSDKLVLFAWQPSKDIAYNSTQLGINVAVITLLTIVVLSALIFHLLSKYITHPIRDLEQFTREIGRGDFSGVATPRSGDEIGSLARAFNDMSQKLVQSNEQIMHLAYHDELTGLPNRLMFQEYLTQAVSSAKRLNKKLGILYIDLDNFKRVNDTMGHKAGDQLLKEVSERIIACLRETDFFARKDGAEDVAARIGGDEFLLLLNDLPDSLMPAKVAERILETLATPFIVNATEFFVSASIGITVFPEDAGTPDDLIKHADLAMYHAKENGKNIFQYFFESMNEKMQERIILENKLRRAIKEGHLVLHYQPQVVPANGAIDSVEALVRWNDPDDGLIYPNQFIPIAEETGLILELGEWALLSACQQARKWQLQLNRPIGVSVNVSAIQFAKTDLPALISRTLKETGLDPALLNIEITETVVMENIDQVITVLEQIRELGCEISLDDFGTGYSSLNYLQQLPIDYLKIDRSFVSELGDEREDKNAIITAIIVMSHILGLRVIAEGIETEQQAEILTHHQCDFVQGYYYHRPMDTDSVSRLLAESEAAVARGQAGTRAG